MGDTRQNTPNQKKLSPRYFAFLDEETSTIAEVDAVELSDEARQMQQADGYFESAV